MYATSMLSVKLLSLAVSEMLNPLISEERTTLPPVQRPTATKDPNTKQRRRRDAATVAGYAGPGFHIWPSGHILQDPDTNVLIRIRPPAFTQKSFGETFGAATGVSDPSYKKSRYETTIQAATPPL